MIRNQYHAAITLARLFDKHPEIDGKVTAYLLPRGLLDLQVTGSLSPAERDEIFDYIVGIIDATIVTGLEHGSGRGAWQVAQGSYAGNIVSASKHFEASEAEALHVAAETAALASA